jgi:hypothetical protein
MGAGVVIRDTTSECLAACPECFANVQIPELAEAIGIRVALSFAEEGLDNIVIATYCLSVVHQVRSLARDRSVCAPIIEYIKELVASFTSCSIKLVSRMQRIV